MSHLHIICTISYHIISYVTYRTISYVVCFISYHTIITNQTVHCFNNPSHREPINFAVVSLITKRLRLKPQRLTSLFEPCHCHQTTWLITDITAQGLLTRYHIWPPPSSWPVDVKWFERLDGTVSRGGVKACWFTEAMWRYEANDNTTRTPTQGRRGDWRGITGIVSVIWVTDETCRHVLHFPINRGESFHNICRTVQICWHYYSVSACVTYATWCACLIQCWECTASMAATVSVWSLPEASARGVSPFCKNKRDK